MALLLCHACSNINSHSGEACILHVDPEGAEELVHGKMDCLRNYTIPVTEEERKESGMILPDTWNFETDFYIVDSLEAKTNYKKVTESNMWETITRYVETEAEYLKSYPEKRDFFEKIGNIPLNNKKKMYVKYKGIVPKSAFSVFSKMFDDNDIEHIMGAKPCTLETDPLKSRFK